METRELRALLERVAKGEASASEAERALRTAPFTDLGYAKADHHRGLRQGVSEVVYGEGKTAEQIAGICRALADGGQKRVLVTRLDAEKAAEVERLLSQGKDAVPLPFEYRDLPRLGILGGLPAPDGDGELAGAGRHADNFAFRLGRSRETAFSREYDELYELLRYERDHGYVVWVMGPAFSFNGFSRTAFSKIIEAGYVDAVFAGNALATHDLEGSYFHTALGQDIETQENRPLGHYNHLDTINRVRLHGSIARFIEEEQVCGGIMHALEKKGVPYVLAGSIRDDGPLPSVIGNAYEAQDAMRDHLRKATTVVCMATMLHTIATGNMTPSYRVLPDGTVRQVYFYCVDIAEFAVNKLIDRGSLASRGIVTNVQDFIANVAKGLGL